MSSYSSYSSYNSSELKEDPPLSIIVSANVVLYMVTVVGNIMVIAAYIRDDKIRQTVAYTLILNLAITDLLVGLFIFPINTIWWIQVTWKLGETVCKIWLVLDYSVLMMSTFTIVFISLDRYWLLTKGLEYQKFQTFRQVFVVLSLAWCITILLYLFIAFVYPLMFDDMPFDSETCELEVMESAWFNLFELIVQFIIPFCALMFLNYKVYSNIRSRARGMVSLKYESSLSDGSNDALKEHFTKEETNKIPQSYAYVNEVIELKEKELNSSNSISLTSLENENGNGLENDHGGVSGDGGHVNQTARNVTYSAIVTNIDGPDEVRYAHNARRLPPVVRERRKSQVKREKSEFKRHRKAAITLAVLVTVFCVCWLPYYVYAIILSFTNDVNDTIWEVVSYFQWCNSAINPFIYGFTNVLFRRNFIKFMYMEKCVNKSHFTLGSSRN